MKKRILTLVALLTLVNFSKAQHDLWSTTRINQPEDSPTELGTQNNKSLHFVTYDTVRVVIDSLGKLKLPSLIPQGSNVPIDPVNFLFIDNNGVVSSSAKGLIGEGTTMTCGSGNVPWRLGGNNVGLFPNGNNVIGPCNNKDFFLQSNAKKTLVISTSGKVGIGEGNNPSSILDLSDPDITLNNSGIRQHLRFYADDFGVIESTEDLNLSFSREFNIRKGPYINGTWPSFLNINNNGNVGINTAGVSSQMLTIDGGNSNGAMSKVSSNAKAFSVYNNSNSNETFAVSGNGFMEFKVFSPNGMPNGRVISILDVFNNKDLFAVKSNGVVHAREVEISNVQFFPDYVFNTSYNLLPIKNVAEFIKVNKHLPGFKEGSFYEKNGININELMIKQQEKIEEMMLYIIQLENRISKIEK